MVPQGTRAYGPFAFGLSVVAMAYSIGSISGIGGLVDLIEAVVRSDPNLLAEIIQNFVSNAIRYTDNGTVAAAVIAWLWLGEKLTISRSAGLLVGNTLVRPKITL